MGKQEQGLAGRGSAKADGRLAGEKPTRPVPWPGREADLDPPADHGETSYQGAGKLAGKRAFVTGGDSGIGRAIAIAFAREGADVAIGHYDEHEDAQETLRWVVEAGRKGLAIQADLSERGPCREAIAQVVAELGGIDILVNNAGRQTVVPTLADLTPEVLARTFGTNLFGFMWLAQAALEHMGDGSVILQTGSIQGLDPSPPLQAYAATKAAIHSFTKSLAKEVAPRGIRVNAVSPGPVWTPLIASTLGADTIPGFGHDTAWERPAQPIEIATSFVFLASQDGRYYTGEIFAPTGKLSTR